MDVTPAPLEALEILRRQGRAGGEGGELRPFLRHWLAESATDVQMAAWLAGVQAAGMPERDVRVLASELIASGDRLDLAALGATGTIAATGAVGEDVVLVAAPLATALGVRVAVVADRGLGLRGGTVDALEAVPGVRTALSLQELVSLVRDTGCAVVGAGDRLVPGERRLSALRHQTATADTPALTAAAVMARALAVGAAAIAVHVTAGPGGGEVGDGGDEAAALMRALAGPWGSEVRVTVARGAAPVGRRLGAALSVAAAGEVLTGGGDADLRRLAVQVAGDLAEAARVVPDGEGREAAGRALADGSAVAAAERWIEGQGGDAAVWTVPGLLPRAPRVVDVAAAGAGTVRAVDALALGAAVRRLGAGRVHPAQTVDPAVGLELLVAPGDPIGVDDVIARVHARDDYMARVCADEVRAAISVGGEPSAGAALRIDRA